ncbi:MAG: hypothetical protein HKN76_04855, partial [Saprospiraceae bacterium]|nr:hypothetical protein [Saprospiraceae bacterium]
YTTTAVYRFVNGTGGWSQTRLDTLGGANNLPLNGSITDIAIDYADVTGNSIYISMGGQGDYRHVWHFNGTQWAQRSGPSAGHANSLLDVQHNAIVTDPTNTQHIYVGADIGVWRSTDGGANWASFSENLPDASVMDLKLHPRRMLRASTHGRGVYERLIDTASAAGIELYVRDTQLDQGRFTTVNNLDDPTDMGEVVKHWRGPDIKLDTPDAGGNYQFPLTGVIDFVEFTDILNDDSRQVATHATATIITRVYVQVHNRGVTPADNVQVMALLANASAGLPALPAGYEVDVQNGIAINNANWQTLGIVTLDDVRVGFPKVASFSLDSSMLPPPASLSGNDHHCVLALIHHPDDQYLSTQTNTDQNSKIERKAAHKNLKVVQFTGTIPPPVIVPFRISNALLEKMLITRLTIRLNNYAGRVRIYLPHLKVDGDIREFVSNAKPNDDFRDFHAWAEEHVQMLKLNQQSRNPYHKEWTLQRQKDIEQVMNMNIMFETTKTKEVIIDKIHMEPNSYSTIFVLFDRPENAKFGDTFDIEVIQQDVEREMEVIGGLDLRVEVKPEPKEWKYFLRLWQRRWRRKGDTIILSRLYNSDDEYVSPEKGGAITLTFPEMNGLTKPVKMKWHRRWKAYYYILRGTKTFGHTLIVAKGSVDGKKVAGGKLMVESNVRRAFT